MKNAFRRREFREYVLIILKAVKFAKLRFVTNQITIIYNEFNVKFQRNLTRSPNVSSLNTFLRKLNNFKHI